MFDVFDPPWQFKFNEIQCFDPPWQFRFKKMFDVCDPPWQSKFNEIQYFDPPWQFKFNEIQCFDPPWQFKFKKMFDVFDENDSDEQDFSSRPMGHLRIFTGKFPTVVNSVEDWVTTPSRKLDVKVRLSPKTPNPKTLVIRAPAPQP
eukprot:1172371-Prorocentrum_minimum.AAC.1